MGSLADIFTADAAQFDGATRGERVIITPRGGTPTTVDGVIVLRGAPGGGGADLATRQEDKGRRLEHEIEVQVSIASYPAVRVNVGGDTIAVAIKSADAVLTTRTVSSLLNQVNGMWHLKLD